MGTKFKPQLNVCVSGLEDQGTNFKRYPDVPK